ncbi:G patch domain and ankyrin repeat-containing protein 1 [Alligator sinensis]|uniref:G patch domain and ankyrin repeat-containing protein 1 n=1 Tax=Alligator sinensis TaxID=38654 RepID=A0A1U7SQN8_ALLSI|nr:G patch domain and ankyrin repeat-containing protein 1 [Alligator sinensis]
MSHGVQLIAFTRAREDSDFWKDGQLRKQVSSARERREDPGAGEEARSFYESLLAPGGSSGGGDRSPPRKRRAPRRRREAPAPPPVPPDQTDDRKGNLLLRSAQEGNLRGLRRLLEKEGCNINYRDGFYWTAVMCAAYAGQAEAVRYLLSRGAAWVGVCEAQGRDAMDLAEEAGHENVVEVLRECETARPPTREPRRPPAERKFCAVCQAHYSEDTVELHERSTAHLFNRRDPLPPTRYHIPETNVGFQLMVKGGWDREAGLGPEGSGRRFPVQTILKRDQKGLGFRSDLKPKVTHFDANDPSSVAQPSEPRPRAERAVTVGKQEARRREAKEKAWERDLRMYMNLDL